MGDAHLGGAAALAFPLLPAGCGPSVHIPRRDGPAILATSAAEALASQADRLGEPAVAEAVLDSFCRLLAVGRPA